MASKETAVARHSMQLRSAIEVNGYCCGGIWCLRPFVEILFHSATHCRGELRW